METKSCQTYQNRNKLVKTKAIPCKDPIDMLHYLRTMLVCGFKSFPSIWKQCEEIAPVQHDLTFPLVRLRPPQPELLSWKSVKSFQESEEEGKQGWGGGGVHLRFFVFFFERETQVSKVDGRGIGCVSV